jgi:hypothetical protein
VAEDRVEGLRGVGEEVGVRAGEEGGGGCLGGAEEVGEGDVEAEASCRSEGRQLGEDRARAAAYVEDAAEAGEAEALVHMPPELSRPLGLLVISSVPVHKISTQMNVFPKI